MINMTGMRCADGLLELAVRVAAAEDLIERRLRLGKETPVDIRLN